jgi:hypothetical protein
LADIPAIQAKNKSAYWPARFHEGEDLVKRSLSKRIIHTFYKNFTEWIQVKP